MKKVWRVLGICLLAVMVLIVLLLVKIWIEARKASIKDDYYTAFSSVFPLEQKYSQLGPCAVSYTEFASDNRSIQRIRVWYPAGLEASEEKCPVIVAVNASGTPASNYEGWFKRLASWGFVVVGNEDPQAGTGETTSIMLDFLLSLSSGNVLCGKLDEDNIGIVGFSQSGAGALAAVTEYENGAVYKAMFTGSAAYPLLARNLGWFYDISKVGIPYFMAAGTGTSDDAGVADPNEEYAGVAPLSSLIENYDSINDTVFKVRGRAAGAEHGDMLARSDGYLTAWMLYQLKGDVEAGTVFLGGDAEILHNSNWQDVMKNQ